MAAVASLILPEGYGLVIASVFAMCLTYLLTSIPVGPKRQKVFTEEFMKRHFGEQHKKEIGTEIKKGGYPDMGNGRYADKLSYKEWYEFNNVQRTHYQFLEQIAGLVPVTLIAGLTFPMATAGVAAVYTVGRVVFAVGYSVGGPSARLPGAITNFFGGLALMVMGGMSAFQLAFKL